MPCTSSPKNIWVSIQCITRPTTSPTHQNSIRIAASLKEEFPAPSGKYRGFFINDEDMLTGWAPAAANENTGISLEVWNKIYETTLRLKGNMVAPGTWIFPDDAQVKLAAKRGLIVTQHHAIPLGLNVARWPRDVPYNYSAHPEILEHAWRNAVSSYLPNQEVLWSVGLRGLSDVTYASMDASVQNDNKALAQLISKAIADQMSIVHGVRPDAKFVTNLWQEGARLVQQGLMKIPPEVSTVWADDGYGYLQDHGEVTAGQGAYDHVAMMNGRANQLTEMVPIERSFSEMGRYITAGATDYSWSTPATSARCQCQPKPSWISPGGVFQKAPTSSTADGRLKSLVRRRPHS